MRNIVFFILIVFSTTIAFSQNEKQIDSLMLVLQTNKNFVEVVNTLNDICFEYDKNNSEKFNLYNQKILAISKRHDYQIGYGFYYLNCSRLQLSNNNKESLNFSKKAAAIFLNKKDIKNYLIAITEVSKSYVLLNESQKCKSILHHNLNKALAFKNNDIIVDFYRLLGSIYTNQDSIAKSLFYFKRALPYLSKEKSISKSIFFQKISDQYTVLNQNDKGLIYIDLAIANKEKNYKYLAEAKKALILNNLGRHTEALALSLKNYQSILKFKMTSKWQYNLILYNIANAYYNLKKNNLAIPYIKKAIDSKNTIPEYKIECYLILSNIYFESNRKIQAQYYSQKALIFHDSIYEKFGNFELYSNVSRIEEDLGNYKKALYFYRKQVDYARKINDQINNENNLLLQTDFDVAVKDNNIKALQEEKAINTIENLEQKNYIMLFGGLLLAALLSVFFFIKNNKTIKNKNIEIEREKILTQKSLTEKEILLKEIHHRVKNNMQMVISLLKIQSLDAKDLTIEDFIKVSEIRINSMVLIHENLYLNESFDKICFKEYLNNLKESIINSQQSAKNIQLEVDVNEICLDIQTAIPIGLIVNELVNNSYKHAFKNKDQGLINIQLIQKDAAYQLTVSDNGLGISDHQKNEKSLGLELVLLLVSQIKGVSQIENSNGTCFTMQFNAVTV